MTQPPIPPANNPPPMPPVPPIHPMPSPILAYATSPSGIREIAFRQRLIMLCILAYLAAIALQFALPPELRIVVAVIALSAIIAGTVFVFLLATKVYSTGLGVLLGILTLIPCIGLIVLLIVNAKATALLRAAGLKVGLLGATVPPNFGG